MALLKRLSYLRDHPNSTVEDWQAYLLKNRPLSAIETWEDREKKIKELEERKK